MHTQLKKPPGENGIQSVLVYELKRISLGKCISYSFPRDPFGPPPLPIDKQDTRIEIVFIATRGNNVAVAEFHCKERSKIAIDDDITIKVEHPTGTLDEFWCQKASVRGNRPVRSCTHATQAGHMILDVDECYGTVGASLKVGLVRLPQAIREYDDLCLGDVPKRAERPDQYTRQFHEVSVSCQRHDHAWLLARPFRLHNLNPQHKGTAI